MGADGRLLGGEIISRLDVGESLLWEGKPLFFPFFLGSPRATGLGAGAVLFFLVGAALILLDEVLKVTAPLFLLALVAAFLLGYLIGAYLDWRALMLALTDKRFLAFGEGFPLGGWELSFPLKGVLGAELLRGWVNRGDRTGTFVIHGLVGGSAHTSIWPGIPEVALLEEWLRDHVLAHAKGASIRPFERLDGEAATKVVLTGILSPGEKLLWAGRRGKTIYALTERRLLALDGRGRFLSWLRLDSLKKASPPPRYIRKILPHLEKLRPSPPKALKRANADDFLSLLSEVLSESGGGKPPGF